MIEMGIETGNPRPVAQGVVDRDGVLVSAEPALDELNRRAGGAVGRSLAVPALAAIAGLARRLGITVSRRAVVADDEGDIELWVRARPEGDRVDLAISGWRERAAWAPAIARGLASGDDGGADGEGGWRWDTDAALRLTRLSIAAGRRHGFDAVPLLGQPITALFALDDDDGRLPLVEAFARREPLAGQRARLRQSGAAVLLSAGVSRDATGRFGGFIGRAQPVAIAEPPVESPLTGHFVAGLDRALRRPLARIIANADSINGATDGPVAPDYADYAADIAHAGRHLLALVDDLVDLQAVERPDFAVAADAIDLADVARRAAGLLGVRASEAGVTVERPLPGVTLWACGDFRRALQIVVNLIGNAVRYAPRGSIVLVGLSREGSRVSLVIADEGKGIASADQARVFEKFERVDPGEPGGNGLGLYIARRLARAMGGDLTLASAPGEGARFTLTLPAPAPAEPPRDEDQR